MCETTFLPMTRILTGRQQIFGPPEYFATGVDYGGDNMGMNFYLDREYTVKKFFDAWLDTIIEKGPQDAIAPQFVTSYPDQYKSRAFIKQLDEQDNVTYAAELIDLFPVATNVVTLDHNLSNQPSRLNVTFNYRYWTPLTVLPPKRPLASKGLLDILMGLFNGSNPIESPSLKPGFDPFHPETSPASEAYWLKK